MFQQLITGSIAVLTRPSAPTFEEHEQDNLGWATLYVVLGTLIVSVLAAISFVIQRPFLEAQFDDLRAQIDDLAAQGVDTTFLEGFIDAFATGSAGPTASIFVSVTGSLLGFFISLAVVWAIGRAFGGTGTFGQLGWNMALFSVPLSVISAAISVVGIGPLANLTNLIGFGLWLYNLYLTYLAIQAGMNLPGNKALYVMLTIIGIVVGLFACSCLAIFGLALTAASAVSG
jgi:hypothetical protein